MADTIILSARQSLEFPGDGIRLTALSMPTVVDAVRHRFGFHRAMLGRPQGSVGPNTIPPGIVFQVGIWNGAEAGPVMIRFINIEAQRIVFDVAGPSEVLPEIVGEFFGTVRQVARTYDDGVALADPSRILDYSEMTVKLPESLDILWDSKIRKLIAATTSISKSDTIIPGMSFQVSPPSEPYGGDPAGTIGGNMAYQLSLRRQTLPGDLVYFSGAPLPTTPHKNYLDELHDIVVNLAKSSRPD